MPDITMCRGQGCNLKEWCYRYKAIPDEFWQYFFADTPVNISGEVHICDYFWETKEFIKIKENAGKDTWNRVE